MSVEAITWALQQPIQRSSAKFVLVALANCANHDGECWPSQAYLCQATAQDRKTLQANLLRLQAAGYLSDSGRRRGHTRQIVVWLLHEPPALDASAKQTENGPVADATDKVIHKADRKRAPSPNQRGPFFPSKEPVFPVKGAQKRATEPSGTVKEINTPLPPLAAEGVAKRRGRPKSKARSGKDPGPGAAVLDADHTAQYLADEAMNDAQRQALREKAAAVRARYAVGEGASP